MCKVGGEQALVDLDGKTVCIDPCLVDFIKLVNQNYKKTVACCCGHGNRPGVIAFEDGSEFIIARNWEEARHIERAVPYSITGLLWDDERLSWVDPSTKKPFRPEGRIEDFKKENDAHADV